jgi:hypothetical protein
MKKFHSKYHEKYIFFFFQIKVETEIKFIPQILIIN